MADKHAWAFQSVWVASTPYVASASEKPSPNEDESCSIRPVREKPLPMLRYCSALRRALACPAVSTGAGGRRCWRVPWPALLARPSPALSAAPSSAPVVGGTVVGGTVVGGTVVGGARRSRRRSWRSGLLLVGSRSACCSEGDEDHGDQSSDSDLHAPAPRLAPQQTRATGKQNKSDTTKNHVWSHHLIRVPCGGATGPDGCCGCCTVGADSGGCCGVGGCGADSGGYHLPSEASHHPGSSGCRSCGPR